MSVTFEWEAQNGQRFHRYGCGIQARDAEGRMLWFDGQAWALHFDHGRGYSNTAHPARTFKAFKRHLRRHADALSGCEVIWVNRFVGYNCTARVHAGDSK